MNLITVLLLVLSLLGQTAQAFASNSLKITTQSEKSLAMEKMDHSNHSMDSASQIEMTMECCDSDCDCATASCSSSNCSISSGSSGVLLNGYDTVLKSVKVSFLIDLYQVHSAAFINSSLYRPPITL